MKVAIIGGGFGLRVQAPIIQSYAQMNLVAVSTMHRHQIPDEISNDVSIRHYTDWIEMLDKESLDLVFVSSLPTFHYEMVKHAIEQGIHVICEKPFTINKLQAKELLHLSEQYHAKVLIDFEWRYLPIRQKVKDLIRSHELGELIHLEYHISTPQYQHLQSNKRGWMGEKHHFGGMLGAIGTHMIDCLRWLSEDEMADISGFVHTHVPEGAEEQRDADDAFFIHGRMKRLATFSMQFISGIHHGFGSSLKIFGNQGTLTLHNDEKLCLGKANESLTEIKVPSLHDEDHRLSLEAHAYYQAFFPFLEKAYEYMVHSKTDKDIPTIYDAYANQLVIDPFLSIDSDEQIPLR
ncbi:oxidoreductase [Paenibacillus selenitireducens]|uniref:Oxidoreductase n=1 Tax=Paenibacillus selenitireducens TaxID=1324314 RepID=A0A1T2XFE9_9BACL|nr:Gfo/Idh/MocA family oxidoreductase [Paenibacillus selenitireducens]OPA78611.1 oxidoreductase [Paenibacillus selenitireducens]